MSDATASSDRRPPPGPERTYDFPAFVRERIANGMELIIARMDRLPLVTIRVLIDAGAEHEPLNLAGVAHLTASGLAEGTVRMDGAQLAVAFERLGSSLSSIATWDSVQAGTTVLAERLDEALDLLADVVRTPAFPGRDVQRLRDERLAEILELRTEPRGLADERFEGVLYDASSRYAWPEAGGEETVAALTRDDCAAYHRQQFHPGTTTLVVAGDVDVDAVRRAAERAFGAWRVGDAPTVNCPVPPARNSRAVHVVGRPGAPQVELRLGHIGIPRRHPDYFRVVVMNAVLGGLFNSRLNLNLRERHGFTYGAFSSFDWRRNAGPFVMSTAVATSVTGAAVREMLREFEELRTTPPSDAELSLATSYLQRVFPIRFETTEAVAGALGALRVFGLPGDYFDTYRSRIAGVTAGDVSSAALQHLEPDRLQLVAVGDPAAIVEQLEDLQFGPVLHWGPDGRPRPS